MSFFYFYFCCYFLHSTDSGQDNPFRPDGDLSREADELLELLKNAGRPISEVLKNNKDGGQQHSEAQLDHADHVHQDDVDSAAPTATVASSPANGSASGSPNGKSPVAMEAEQQQQQQEQQQIAASAASPLKASPSSPTAAAGVAAAAGAAAAGDSVEVQHGIVAPIASESQAVEHVVIKKNKSKNKCCVLQ